MAKKKVTQLVTEELSPFLEENGYSLFDVEFVKEGKDWFLRIYIEYGPIDGVWPDQGIGIDDCVKVNDFISSRLDELDPIEQNYFLEVSSPGMDRPLRSETDFHRFQGKQIDISLYKAIDGVKHMTGVLIGLEGGNVKITDLKGNKQEIPLEQISKTRLTVVF